MDDVLTVLKGSLEDSECNDVSGPMFFFSCIPDDLSFHPLLPGAALSLAHIGPLLILIRHAPTSPVPIAPLPNGRYSSLPQSQFAKFISNLTAPHNNQPVFSPTSGPASICCQGSSYLAPNPHEREAFTFLLSLAKEIYICSERGWCGEEWNGYGQRKGGCEESGFGVHD